MAFVSKILVGICLVPFAAAAVPLNVSAFYVPAFVVGPAADEPDLSHGFKVSISVGDRLGFTPKLAVGYSVLSYGIYKETLFAIFKRIESFPTFTVDAGIDYGLGRGRLNPYIGGGVVFAIETPNILYHETFFDFAPGIYLNGGSRIKLSNSWASDVAPRFVYLFDDPVRAAAGRDYLVRAGARTHLVEILAGVNYSF